MELIDIARELWARRRLVAVGLIVSAFVGGLVIYSVSLGLPPKLRSRQHYVGQAAAQVLIDTPTSQIADLKPMDPSLIYTRATLLADLIATGPVQSAIASRVGIPAGELAVTPPPSSVVVPIKASPLAVAGTKAATSTGSWRLSVTVDPVLPIIAFSAVAPTPQRAQALVTQAIGVLRQHTNAIAVADHIPSSQRLVVNLIGPPAAASLAVGPRKLYGVAVAAVMCLLICCAIVAASGMRRRAAARKRVPDWFEDEREVASAALTGSGQGREVAPPALNGSATGLEAEPAALNGPAPGVEVAPASMTGSAQGPAVASAASRQRPKRPNVAPKASNGRSQGPRVVPAPRNEPDEEPRTATIKRGPRTKAWVGVRSKSDAEVT